ncbi:hypothetical protein IEQ34_000284 [Dendrobium chrysotoxum]|uniref:Uncharacterized protein n=1 Tax=Dendrobium chrysotoxum TaxID=161865 RepID=A0AAV7HNP0_DENCH|nr:hypothetical protein IEQ34_000284 [Dendrobium chrysotoxum]
MGEGDQLDHRSKEAQKEGGTNALLFTGYAYSFYWAKRLLLYLHDVLLGSYFYERLSSDEVDCRKRVTETIEIVVVKKSKMEERPMPYFL